MKTCILSSIILCLAISESFAFHIDWAKSYGSDLDDYGYFVAFDSINNRIYLTGTSDSAISSGDTISNVFLASYDADGNPIWQTKIKSLGANTSGWMGEPEALQVDNNGDIILCGWSCQTIVVDTIELEQVSNKGCDYSSGDKFVAKFNPSGHVVWAKRFYCASQCDFRDLCLTPDGIYYCAAASGNVQIDSVQIGNSRPAFICKLTPLGKVIWTASFSGYCRGIKVFPLQTNMRLIMSFGGSASYQGHVLFGNNDRGLVFCTLSKDGNISIGQAFHNVDVFLTGKAADTYGNIYFSGIFNSSFSLGKYQINTTSSTNIFIAKVDNNDSIIYVKTPSLCQWQARGMLVGSQSLAWHPSNKLLYTGSFSGTLAFDHDTLRVDSTQTGNLFDGFLFIFDSNFYSEYAQQLASPKIDAINGISLKGKYSFLLSGFFSSTGSFMNTTFKSAGNKDIFLGQATIDTSAGIADRDDGMISKKSLLPKTFVGFISKSIISSYDIFTLKGVRVQATIDNNYLTRYSKQLYVFRHKDILLNRR